MTRWYVGVPRGYGARVLDVDRLSWLIAVMSLIVMSAAILTVVAGGLLRLLDRRPGLRWSRILTLLSGASVGGLFLETWSDPLQRTLFIAIAGAVTFWLLWRGRQVLAGIFLASTALPWTLLWGLYVIRLLQPETDDAPLVTVTFFVLGLLLVLAGIALAAMAWREAPSANDPPGRPRRIGLVAEAITTPELVGGLPVSELAALVAGFGAVLLVGLLPLPELIEPIAQVVAGTLIGSEARLHVRPGRVRRAYEAFSWLGEWELERVRHLTGHGVPTSKATAERWLRNLPERPDTRWIRVEVLALLERLDEARAVADAMPTETPWERFERISSLDLVDWLAGGQGDPDGVRETAAAVRAEGPEVHLRAEVAVAVRAVARQVADHGPEPALGPLEAMRDRLGSRAYGQLRRALWRRTLPISLVTAVITTYLVSPLG